MWISSARLGSFLLSPDLEASNHIYLQRFDRDYFTTQVLIDHLVVHSLSHPELGSRKQPSEHRLQHFTGTHNNMHPPWLENQECEHKIPTFLSSCLNKRTALTSAKTKTAMRSTSQERSRIVQVNTNQSSVCQMNDTHSFQVRPRGAWKVLFFFYGKWVSVFPTRLCVGVLLSRCHGCVKLITEGVTALKTATPLHTHYNTHTQAHFWTRGYIKSESAFSPI